MGNFNIEKRKLVKEVTSLKQYREEISTYMLKEGLEFICDYEDECYFKKKSNGDLIIVPAIIGGTDVFLDTSKARTLTNNKTTLDNYSVTLSTFYQNLDNIIKSYGYEDIYDVLDVYENTSCREKDIAAYIIQYGVVWGLQSSLTSIARSATNYYEARCYKINKDNSNSPYFKYLESLKKDIEQIYSSELTDSKAWAKLSQDGKSLEVHLPKVLGTEKYIELDLTDFYSDKAKKILELQLNKLAKQTLIESPYNLMERFNIISC